MKCDGGFITLTATELIQIASQASDHHHVTQWTDLPAQIPRGMRAVCTSCGREDVLVLPFCLGYTTGSREDQFSFAIRGHEKKQPGTGDQVRQMKRVSNA